KVALTDLVVRSISRTPRRCSRLRTCSLTRGGERPINLAALVKLLLSRTATNAFASAKSGIDINDPFFRRTEWFIQTIRHYSIRTSQPHSVAQERPTLSKGPRCHSKQGKECDGRHSSHPRRRRVSFFA